MSLLQDALKAAADRVEAGTGATQDSGEMVTFDGQAEAIAAWRLQYSGTDLDALEVAAIADRWIAILHYRIGQGHGAHGLIQGQLMQAILVGWLAGNIAAKAERS